MISMEVFDQVPVDAESCGSLDHWALGKAAPPPRAFVGLTLRTGLRNRNSPRLWDSTGFGIRDRL